jgi:hypothetical protein
MNWYKIAQDASNDLLSQLSMLDTRGKKAIIQANELILKDMDIKVGDKLFSLTGMSNGPDKNYEVRSINPDFSLSLLSETGRVMNNVPLFNALKSNQPAWKKV